MSIYFFPALSGAAGAHKIYLPRQLGGTALHSFRSLAEGVELMYVTYNNLFTFVLMIVAIITLVKSFNDRHKK